MTSLRKLQSNRENLGKARESARIGKRGKGQKTLAKEKARELFEQKVMEKWDKLIDTQLKAALKDGKDRRYTIDQLIGKPSEKKKVEQEIDIIIDF